MSTPVEFSSSAPQRVPARRVSQRVGMSAGLLVAGLLLGLLGGVAWGFLRPTYVGHVEKDTVVIDSAASDPSAQFAALGWFTALTACIGAALAGLAWLRSRRGAAGTVGGIGLMLWVTAVALAAAYAVAAAGDAVVQLLYPSSPHDVPPGGASFELAPPISPRIAWLVAPFSAALVYWVLNFLAYAGGAHGDRLPD